MRDSERFDPCELRELAAWRDANGDRFTAFDFVCVAVSPAAAIALAEVFWPRFVEVEGCVLIAEQYNPANFRAWWQSLDGDIPRVEWVINHLHLCDLFPTGDDPAINRGLQSLAHIMAQCWEGALRQAFPDRQFAIEVTDDADEDYDGPTVAFYSNH
jgi:hypothetical protein